MKSIKLPSWTDALLGLGEIAVPPHAFFLGPERLSYASFQDSSSGRALLQEVEVPISPTWFGEGVIGGPIQEEAAFHTALETLIGKLVEPPSSASLVLPGEWIRATYLNVDHTPKKRAELDEVVRWKLRQVVPFRIDDVRISHTQIGAGDSNRFLVAFAIDQFLRQLESAFSARGITLGSIQPISLALFEVVPHDDGVDALLWASDRAVSLIAREDGDPVLLRYRRIRSADLKESTVRRDLRLSRSWSEENTKSGITRLRIAVPTEERNLFESWCRKDLGVETVEHLDLSPNNLPPGSEWRLAPLLGAVNRRVA